MFSKLFSPRLNHNEYTTLEYNTVISITGMIPATKNQMEVYALGSHCGLGQYSMHKSAFWSKKIVKKRGMLRITAEIHDTGIMICQNRVSLRNEQFLQQQQQQQQQPFINVCSILVKLYIPRCKNKTPTI